MTRAIVVPVMAKCGLSLLSIWTIIIHPFNGVKCIMVLSGDRVGVGVGGCSGRWCKKRGFPEITTGVWIFSLRLFPTDS